VICGNEQQTEIDYFETFVLVLQYTTLRILLTKAVAEDLKADYINIDTVFLNPDLEKEIYIKVPEFPKKVYPELEKTLDVFLKLNKSLYRLKQTFRV
jgi:hypothetical protein